MEETRTILEWLIEDIDFSNPKKLFNKKHKKEVTTNQNISKIFELEKVDYRGRAIIQREEFIIYFYPLTIQDYLFEK